MTRQQIPLQGVNLGGWLVVEKWMTPSLFRGTPAYTEHELANTAEGRTRLTRHHKNFITAGDIAWLAEQGVELLRIPFGHWIFGDQPPYVGAIDRLDWVIEEAGKQGMQVVLDLHGAPEAQNVKAHSGSGNRTRSVAWLDNKTAQDKTIATLVRIAQRYKNRTNVWGIELINEPVCDLTGLKLAHFYRRAYRELTQIARPGTRIIFSDGFHPLLLTNTFWLLAKKDYPVAIDMHIYHCFGQKNKSRSLDQLTTIARWVNWAISFVGLAQPVIVGEWSSALPYRVTKSQTKQFSLAQQIGFRRSLATFYWSYKTESTRHWNFREQITSGQLHISRKQGYNSAKAQNLR